MLNQSMKPCKSEAGTPTHDARVPEVDHREVGRQLASMSGVDLSEARPATVRAWEARGLALQALARGDMAGAQKVMNHVKGGIV